MKKYLLLFPLLFIAAGLQAQTDTVSPKISKIPHKRVDAAARFLQGDFKNYIATHLQYNHKTDHSITGNIILLVVIEADGGINNVTVFKSLSQIIDQEVVNIIKASPKWQPAMLNGQKVSMDILFNIDIAIKGTPTTPPPIRNSFIAVRPPLVPNQKPAAVVTKPATVVIKHNTSVPIKVSAPVIAKKVAAPPAKKPAVVIAKVTPALKKVIPPMVKKPTPVIAKVIPPVKKPVPPIVKKPVPVIAKVIPPVKKPEPPIVKKPAPIIAKVIPPVKKPEPPVVKKPAPVIAKVISPVKKPEPPVVKKPAPVIAKVIPPAKKPEPPIVKKPAPIIVKVVTPAKKPTPPIVKKPAPAIAKVVPPVKKPEPLIAKKEEPVIVKKTKRVVAKADLFHPSGNYPIFPGGGLPAFFRYLGGNIVYPMDSKKAGISGNVVLSFTVNEEGNIEDVEIISSPAADLGQEAIRVLLASPRWKPAKQNGTPVPVSYEIPIKFTLSEKTPAEKTTN